MSLARSIFRSIPSFILGFALTLIIFGLLLALLWAILPETLEWKDIGVIVSAAAALCAGGFVVAGSSGAPDWVLPAVFGFFFGGISFLYIFGPSWIVLAATAASTLLAALGGFFYRKMMQKQVSLS